MLSALPALVRPSRFRIHTPATLGSVPLQRCPNRWVLKPLLVHQFRCIFHHPL